MTGWEITDFTECLMTEPKGEITGLDIFSAQYPLAALSSDKKYFVVIRDFSFHITDGRINMTNSKGSEEKVHKGMTIVKADKDGGNYYNVILPDALNYTRVELIGIEIHIYHGELKTITNFQEINKLWTLYKLSEEEILKTFQSFTNEYIERTTIEKQSVNAIETKDFGVLSLNKETDSYCSIIKFDRNEIQLSFSNIDKKQFYKNLTTAKKVFSKLGNIQENMINEMLKLKNDVWLEEEQNELNKNEFAKEIQFYGLNVYEDGTMQIYYRAGDLFWGHEIFTYVDSDGKYIDSKLVG
jgi:hypothetical protein